MKMQHVLKSASGVRCGRVHWWPGQLVFPPTGTGRAVRCGRKLPNTPGCRLYSYRPFKWSARSVCRCHGGTHSSTVAIPEEETASTREHAQPDGLLPTTGEMDVVSENEGHGLREIPQQVVGKMSGSEVNLEEPETVEPCASGEDDTSGFQLAQGSGKSELDPRISIKSLAELITTGQMEDQVFAELPDSTVAKVIAEVGGQSRGLDDARRIVEWAIKANSVSDAMLASFFTACCAQARLDVVESCFSRWLKEGVDYGEKSISALSKGAVDNMDSRFGMVLFQELFKYEVLVGTSPINSLIWLFGRVGEIDDALELFSLLRSQGQCSCNADTYKLLLWGMRHTGKLEELDGVLQAFEEDGLEMNVALYYAFMYSARNALDVEIAERVLEIYKGNGKALECRMLNLYLLVYVKSSRYPQDLQSILNTYASAHDPPDAETFSLVFTAAYRTRQSMAVIDGIVEELLKRGLGFSSSTGSGALIGYKNCALDPLPERCLRAERVFDAIQDKTQACYHTMISFLIENFDLAGALRLQRDMENAGFSSCGTTYKMMHLACLYTGMAAYASKYEKLWKERIEKYPEEKVDREKQERRYERGG